MFVLKMDNRINIFLIAILSIQSFSGGLQVFFEGSGTYYFFCPPVNFRSLTLYVIINNTDIRAVSCASMPCTTTFGGQIISNASGHYIPIPENQFIKPRLTSGLKCIFNNDSINIYVSSDDILIATKPNDVQCEPPRITTDQSNVIVTCKTTKVFPKASCVFSCVGCQDLSIQGVVTYSHTNYTDIFPYYQSSCVWTSPLSNFLAGNYSFNVFLYIINSTDVVNGVNSLSSSLQLKLPIMNLSSECFNNQNIIGSYFKPGSTVSCVCYLDKLGYPVGNIIWIDSAGVDISSFKNSTVVKLDLLPFQGSRLYQCLYTNSLKNGNFSLSYSVNYAFGPTTCTVSTENHIQTVWSKCDAKSINITIVCDVNQADVSPNMSSVISVNSSKSPLLNGVIINNVYRSKYESSLIQAGNYTIMCQAQNSIFSDDNADCYYSQILQVREPPTSFPNFVLKKNDGYTTSFMEIVDNEKYTVECSVDGGIPLVSNLTVSCGNILGITQSGNIFTSPVTFTRNMTGHKCTCTAQHITGCYTKNKLENFTNIQYISIVTNLSVYNRTLLENGSSIQFICEADGNPLPKIDLMKHNNSIFQNSSGNILSLTKIMYCRDSGIYQCQASNGLNKGNTNSQKISVIIYVFCPLQYNSTESILTNYTAKPGDVFTTSFVIYGHPYPDKFTLFKYNSTTNTFIDLELLKIRDNTYQNTDKNIMLNFSPGELPYGTVQLSITNLNLVDFINYILVIYQNMSQNLNYTFTIVYEQSAFTASDDESNVGVIVGCVFGGLAFIALVISVICFARKYEITLKCVNRNKTIHRRKSKYSDLEVTQLQQGHTYETPNFNRTNASYVNTNYVNVDIQLKEQVESPYEKVD